MSPWRLLASLAVVGGKPGISCLPAHHGPHLPRHLVERPAHLPLPGDPSACGPVSGGAVLREPGTAGVRPWPAPRASVASHDPDRVVVWLRVRTAAGERAGRAGGLPCGVCAPARTFVLQDHMFAPVSSWSLPTHTYFLSGWSAKCTTGNEPRRPAAETGSSGHRDLPRPLGSARPRLRAGCRAQGP
jgi:hypothetical protein